MKVRRDDLVRAAGDQAQSRADRLANVEQEIRKAQAEALGRTGERLQAMLDQLVALDRRLDPRPGQPRESAGTPARPDPARSEIETRNRLRDEALRVRHHLMIQREALGFAQQTPVEQCYPVPARRRAPGLPDGRGREP